MTWDKVLMSLFAIAPLICLLWMVVSMCRMNLASRRRMRKWDELSRKAAAGDTEAFIELLESGPGKKNYR